jgi:tetratricopeptide (TPR) repeat protein
VAERLRAAVERVALPVRRANWSGGTISPTVSIGVATAPKHGENVETCFAAADAALYEAKRQGRNVVVSASRSGEHAGRPTLHFDRFTGRQVERRALVDLFNESLRGEPSVVAIVGEAGVGKTALVRELNPEVRLRAGSLVVGRCIDSEVRAPYAPWTSLLDAIRVLRVVPDRVWGELPRLLPTLGVAPSRNREGSRFALFEEVADYLRLAAASRPLVLLLDDMQWADGPSWDLLEHVANRFDGERLLICFTIRDEDVATDLTTRRSRLSRNSRFEEVRLARLTRDELRQWLERVLQQESSAEFLAFLYRHTEGNPFFAVQVLRAMVEEGSLWWNGERWEWRPVSELRLPVAVNDLLARRLARLSPLARRTLAAAAVIDRAIDVDLCVAADIATEDALLDAIDEGLAANVLERERLRLDDRVFFTHALLLDVLRASVNPRRLKRIHERAAAALERTTPGAAAQIAVHYDAAGTADRAYTHALAAADAATAVYAHDEATAYLQIALRHAATPADLARVRVRLADVAEAAGRYEESEELCALALDWFVRQGAAADVVRCRRRILRLKALRGQPPQTTCEECESLLPHAEQHGLEAERIAILSMISQAHSRAGNGGAAVRQARECVELAERYGDTRLLADALTRLGSALLQTDAAEALGLFRRAYALFAERDDLFGQIRCEINVGVASSRFGDMQAAEDAYERALARGRAAHNGDLAGLAALNLGVVTLKRGRYDAARARIEEALELFTRVSNEPHRVAASYNLAHLAREEGRLDEAALQYADVAEQARLLGITEVVLGALGGAGIVAIAGGDRGRAQVCRAEIDEIIRGREDWWFPGRELVEALRIDFDLASSAVAKARARFRHALALAERHDIYGAMWLTRQVASGLGGDAWSLDGEIESIVRRYAPRAEALGFAPIAARFAALVPRAPRRSGGIRGLAAPVQSIDAG